MLSFHNDPSIKQKYVDRLAEHHRLDQIVQRITWDENTAHGCSVGCVLHKYEHKAYENELGLPTWYAHLCDAIFERLPASEAPYFAMQSITEIPIGVNITPVKRKLEILRNKRSLAYAHVSAELHPAWSKSNYYEWEAETLIKLLKELGEGEIDGT